MRAGIKNATSEILLGQDAQIQEGYNTVKYVFEEGEVTLSVNEEEVESIETGYSIQQILMVEQMEMFLDTLVSPYIVQIQHFEEN